MQRAHDSAAILAQALSLPALIDPDLREVDFGGCRCQALALTGDASATDPACELSPLHAQMFTVAQQESAAEPPPFVYRRPRREAPPARTTILDTVSSRA